jgi:hypothetical protein
MQVENIARRLYVRVYETGDKSDGVLVGIEIKPSHRGMDSVWDRIEVKCRRKKVEIEKENAKLRSEGGRKQKGSSGRLKRQL